MKNYFFFSFCCCACSPFQPLPQSVGVSAFKVLKMDTQFRWEENQVEYVSKETMPPSAPTTTHTQTARQLSQIRRHKNIQTFNYTENKLRVITFQIN